MKRNRAVRQIEPPNYKAEQPLSDTVVQEALGFRLVDHQLFINTVRIKFGVTNPSIKQIAYFDRLYVEMLRYLIVKAENPGKALPPSEYIDAFWHEFLMFTEDYQAFCQILGRFVHHRPMREAVGTIAETEKLINGKFRRVWRELYSWSDPPVEQSAWMSRSDWDLHIKKQNQASCCG